MIIVDIETSGIDFNECGIWQIGAVDFLNPKRIFFDECKIDKNDKINKEAMKITGKSEKELRSEDKISQKQLLKKFFEWCRKSKIKNFMCENPQFDVAFLEIKAKKYHLEFPFHHRAFDLHSIANFKYLKLNGKLLIKNKKSDMGLANALEFCGMKDEREKHNALEDAKLTAECFSRLMFGKNLLQEYKKFKTPEYLKK